MGFIFGVTGRLFYVETRLWFIYKIYYKLGVKHAGLS